MLKKRFLLCLLVLSQLALAGCGYRGALYLPEDATDNQPTQEAAPATTPGDRN
ncbi:LPS translocon maturation chaperone LptM [Alteromonas pelagimontana]|uniref:LPS translocon maturation chaperone LptM n=1 Tax=Alteromonas pelagimontana TaxID=1858656 RepID=UPI000A93A1F1|nr:lipoprotein [Alteromonas pelagimontana]